MKNFLSTLFFLGITTTGFAQMRPTATFEGRSSVERPEPNVLIIGCGPAQRICFSVSPIMGRPNKYRLMVPDQGIDVIASPMSTVNGTPFDQLPRNENGEGKTYEIRLEEPTNDVDNN